MKLTVNGRPSEQKPDLSIIDLLNVKNIESPDMVSVELNDRIIKRTEFETTFLKENDQVEFLFFMGGGSSVS